MLRCSIHTTSALLTMTSSWGIGTAALLITKLAAVAPEITPEFESG